MKYFVNYAKQVILPQWLVSHGFHAAPPPLNAALLSGQLPWPLYRVISGIGCPSA